MDTRMDPLRPRVRGLRRAAESLPGVVARSVFPMTRQPDDLQSEVGVRELRDQLGRYVQRAQGGAEVMVTMRGRRVAKLVPVDGTSAFADLRVRGLIREPAAPRGRRRATALIVSFDTSALVELIVDEPGSDTAGELWHRADLLASDQLL